MAKPKFFSGLDCAASAEEMIRLVLGAQLKAMCKLRRRALDWSDPEGVHDMRVCTRRLRSAMSDFRPYVRVRLPRVKLRVIADELGAVRDQDVALMALNELGAQAKAEAAAGIQMIADEFRLRRKVARTKLKAAIRPAMIDEFRSEFQSGLEDLAMARLKRSVSSDESHVIAFREVGRQIIVERIKELRDESHHLYFPFHIKELHELRILGKRLRYAVEMFSGCWEPQLHDIAKEISLLQTSLGELHDCDIWLDELGARLKQTVRKLKHDPTASAMHAGATWLVRHFAAERTEHYRAALGRWQEWTTVDFLGRVEAALGRDA